MDLLAPPLAQAQGTKTKSPKLPKYNTPTSTPTSTYGITNTSPTRTREPPCPSSKNPNSNGNVNSPQTNTASPAKKAPNPPSPPTGDSELGNRAVNGSWWRAYTSVPFKIDQEL